MRPSVDLPAPRSPISATRSAGGAARPAAGAGAAPERIARACATCTGDATRSRSRMINQTCGAESSTIRSSTRTPMAAATRRSSLIETLPWPLSSWAM